MFGRTHVSYGSVARFSSLSPSRRLSFQGGHTRCVLPPPLAQRRPTIHILLRERGGVCSRLPELRSVRSPVVLHHGDTARDSAPPVEGSSSFLLSRRLLRGRRHGKERLPSDPRWYATRGSRCSIPIRAPGVVPSPIQVRLLPHASARDPRDPGRLRSGAVLSFSRKASEGRGARAKVDRVRRRSPSPRAGSQPAQLRRSGQLYRPSCGRRTAAAAREVRCTQRCTSHCRGAGSRSFVRQEIFFKSEQGEAPGPQPRRLEKHVATALVFGAKRRKPAAGAKFMGTYMSRTQQVKLQARLSHAALRDLRWWASLTTNTHVGRAMWPVPDASLFTDASTSGWGAVWNGQVPASGFFDAAREGSSINELELLAEIHGLRMFVRFARSHDVLLVSDSLATVHVVRNWTSRSPRLLAHLRTLHALCETHGVTLSTRHLPSVLNLWADRLSRRSDTASWRLSPTAQLLLQHRFRTQLLDGHGLPPPRAGAGGPQRWCCRGQPYFPSGTGTSLPCGEAS
jgi:ribonuclease HI